jgi:hypothetical protein
VLCGDCTQPDVMATLLGPRKPRPMVTDPPQNGIALDSEWRDRGPERLRARRGQLHGKAYGGPH